MISAGGGATGVLHDFDRPSGCEKKNRIKRKLLILHKFIRLCLSRFTKITYQMSLAPVTKITTQQFVARVCLKSSAVNRGKLVPRKFSLGAGYTLNGKKRFICLQG